MITAIILFDATIIIGFCVVVRLGYAVKGALDESDIDGSIW